MNVQRFLSMPNALKPLILLFLFLAMLLGATAQLTSKPNGMWFFWLNIIVQMVFMAAVCGCFLNDAEIFLGCGREGSWPVVEMTYSGVGVACNFLNTFILSSAHKWEAKGSNNCVVAAFTALFLMLSYAIGGLMMFRIWRGFVKSGASQNPTPNVQPGNIGSMHPGV